jgi:hypothetical protein
MGMKLNAGELKARLGKRYAGLVNPGVSHVEVGVADASIASYATYVEYGWVQRVTGKQSLFLSNAIGKPVPRREDGKPNFQAAAIKPGMALVNPPRPFLRDTMAAEAPKWRKTAKKALHKTLDKERALAILGRQAADDVRMTITSGGTSKEKFPERSSLTLELYRQKAEAKGRKGKGGGNLTTAKPLVLTGKLLNSIGFEVK